MSEYTVIRTLKAPRNRVWEVLTQPSHFEGWLPAKPGTAVLDVRTGGSWQATVISSTGDQIALTGRYDEVSKPDRLVMTVPGDAVTAITLIPAPDDTTQIACHRSGPAGRSRPGREMKPGACRGAGRRRAAPPTAVRRTSAPAIARHSRLADDD